MTEINESANIGLTDDQINDIVDTAEKSIPDGGIDMRDIQNSIEVNTEAELEVEHIVENSVNGKAIIGVVDHPNKNDGVYNFGNFDEGMDEIDKIAASFENQVANVSLFDIENGEVPKVDNATIDGAADIAKGAFDLSDSEVFQMMDTLSKMRDDPKYPVYANLPQKVQLTISKLAYDNKVPINKLDAISRSMMEELLSEAGIDNALIDLERAIDDALKIPSIMDLYTEHTRSVMETIIPQTIEQIKDEFPEKAEMLSKVKDAFTRSYTFSTAREAYNTNSRVRKAIRRYETEYIRCVDRFNYLNEKSNFKMNDARHLYDVLVKILITDPDISHSMHTQNGEEVPAMDMKLLEMDITDIDIKKFCILICKHCRNMNPDDVIDAAYMYYLVRNIIVLRHTQEAKTDFAVELINNICDTITFIRDKEREFNESNMDKSKSTKKSSSTKRDKN